MFVQRWMNWKHEARKHALPRDRHAGVGSFLSLLIVCALVIGTGACSKQPARSTPGAEGPTSAANEDAQPSGAQPPAIPQNNAEAPAVISATGGEVITFATYSFLGEAYKPILEEFHQQYPTITVQVREVPPTLDTRLIASAADTSILMFRPQNGGSSFLDLTPLQEGDASFEPGNYWPGVLDACKDAEGRPYGLPVFVEQTGIFYQEKAFEDAGLPFPGPGWTWADFQKAVDALARTEDGKPVYGFADDSFIDTPDESLLSPRISFLLEQAGGEMNVENIESELQWYLNLVQSGSLYSANIYPQQSPMLAPENNEAWSAAWNGAWSDFHEIFLNHPPAMWKGRLEQLYWSDVDMKALPDGSLNMSAASGPIIQSKEGIGWAPYPVSVDGLNDHTTPNSVTCAVVSAGTEHPRAAWTWLNFLAAHPIMPDWSLAAPAQPSAADAGGYWGRIPEKLREAVRFGLEHGWYSNPYPRAVLAVNQALLKTVTENTELQDALVEARGQRETAILPTADAAPIVVAAPDPTIAPSATVIDYFSPAFADNDSLKKLVETFQSQHPGVTVQVASPTGVTGVAELAEAYDCFAWLPEKDLPAERLLDLSQFLLTEQADLSNDFYPEALDEYSQDGKLFGLPTAYRPSLVYYNADLLARRGLQPPAANWSYADFIALVSAAASGSGAEPVYGLALEYPTQDFDVFLAGRNARLVDASGDVPAYRFDTLETRDAVQWLAEQVETDVVFPVTPFAIGTHADNLMAARRLILDGRVAFWMSIYDHSQGSRYALQEAGFNIGVATVPLPAGAVTWRPNDLAIGQYISRKAGDPQTPRACWDWITFLTGQPESAFGVPARRSVRESAGWVAQAGSETARVYQAALEQRHNLAQGNAYSLGPTRDWWNEMLAEVVSGADPVPLLAGVQKKADAYAACLAATGEEKAQAQAACAEQAGGK